MTLESIKVISEDETLPFRCFIGYAGWGPSQLESELAEEKWLHCPVLPDLVFSPEPDKLWDTVLKNIGIDPVSVLVGDNGIE